MRVISNNLIGKIQIPESAVIRINLAWIKGAKEALSLIEKSKYPIYLDFPSGRTKPPQPKISLAEAINLSNHSKVKYFAISNCENAKDIKDLRGRTNAEIIPKIETKLGVQNMGKMVKVGVKRFMLDKDDLYIDTNCDNEKFLELVNKARKYSVLELQGVIFI